MQNTISPKKLEKEEAKSCSKSAREPVVLKGLRVKGMIVILVDVNHSSIHVPMGMGGIVIGILP